MTVGQYIAELQKYSPDTPLWVIADGDVLVEATGPILNGAKRVAYGPRCFFDGTMEPADINDLILV